MSDTAPKKLYGLGRRKTAIAQALLVPEVGTRTINGLDFTAYFPIISMQNAALLPLLLTSQDSKFGFTVRVHGGGKHSQADAVKLALARALVVFDEGFRKQLKDTGMLTRDARVKERKKFGLKRARRAPQFSKR
jgi:small subunit ribosomal protein S9